MAKIFPERPPQSLIDDPLRSAEMKVYQALRELPDSYRVFYSMHWERYFPEIGVKEGEADFVILHPDKGVIVLEVKGGGISYEASSGKWYSQDRNGEFHEIKDPVEQGRKSHYEIRHKLELLPGWSFRPFNIWHAVCFPDVHLKQGQYFRPDLARESVIDAADLNDMPSTMERLFSHFFGQDLTTGAPGRDRSQLIEGLLANSFQIKSPLGIELEKEDENLITLTDQQFFALELLGNRKRAAISGCAGSGKTMLAMKKAQQFADLGLSVLLVCFNTALSEHLRTHLPEINVYTFHDLCKKAAQQADITLPGYTPNDKYFDEILPEALFDAAEQLGRIYDAIIVDEGQDFRENYWLGLQALLKDDGYLYIFYDDNQNLYWGGNFSGLISEPAFPLTFNCRNTKCIHELVAKFHNNPKSLQCRTPEGRAPELLEYNGENDLLRQLQQIIHRLVVDDHVDPADIVILTPRGEYKTRLLPGSKLGMFTLTPMQSNERYKIQATSVYKFKGLERRVVILAEVDQSTTYNRDMVMYVGCSRARTHLIILSDAENSLEIKERINAHT